MLKTCLLSLAVAFSGLLVLRAERPSAGALRGSVVDAQHDPIRRAYLLIHGSLDGDKRVFLDEHGHFSIELPPGYYDVFISSVGFDPACRKVQIETGKTTVYEETLKVSNLESTPD
jgi:carboxypeptidase family protein